MKLARCLFRLFGRSRRQGQARTHRLRLYRLPRLERLENRIAPSYDPLLTALPLSFAGGPVVHASGTLTMSSQVDLYSVTLNAGDQLTVDVNAQRQGSSLEAALRLFDANGVSLPATDTSNGGDPELSCSVPVAGTYFVGVSSSGDVAYDPTTGGNRINGSTTGLYSLSVTDLLARFVNAISLNSSGQVLQGTLTGEQPQDYRVSATRDTLLIAKVIPLASQGFAPRLILYDATGQLLIQSDHQGPGLAGATVQQHLQPGTYYLEVSAVASSLSSATQQQYQLTTALTSSLPPFASLPVGGLPDSVAVADVNGDGRPDIVTANYSDNTVSVLLGNGDGTFRPDPYSSLGLPPGTFAVGIRPASVAVADVNGDGQLDIVTANSGDKANGYAGTVSVLLGDGKGNFAPDSNSSQGLPAGTFAVGYGARSLVVADVNGDGRPDIVTANFDAGTVSVLLGDGKGDFAPDSYSSRGFSAGTFAVGKGPVSVAVADVNGDGHPDLVTANGGYYISSLYGYRGRTVSVLLGNGKGSFTPDPYRSPGLPAGTFAVGSDPDSVALADVNGDGRLDIVTANYNDNTVSVLLGDGQGNFAPDPHSSPGLPPGAFAVGTSPAYVAVADLGNGHADIVAANQLDDTVSVLLGNADGTFQPAQSFAVGVEPNAVAVADFGNGHPDIVTANQLDNTVSVLLGNGYGTFQPAPSVAVGSSPESVAVADFGNGHPDIVTANFTADTVSVLLGNGDGTFQPAQSFAVGLAPDSVAVADVNGDGRLDIVTASSISNTVSVLLGNGDGTFQPAQTITVGNSPDSVAVADLGNGHADIVTASSFSNTVSVLLGDGDGKFHPDPYSSPGLPAGTFAVGKSPHSVAVADINGDGHPDIVTANSGDTANGYAGTVSVLLGNGDGQFRPDPNSSPRLPAGTFAVGKQPFSVVVADFGNGHPDIVTANYGANTVSVLLGNGDGKFQDAQSFAVGSGPESVAVADLTGDGRPDLVTANDNNSTNRVSVLLGNGNGTFQTAQSFAVGSNPVSVAVAVLTGNGRPDIVTVSSFVNTVSVLLNQGEGQFQAPTGPTGIPSQDVPQLQDLTGDGIPDAVSLDQNTGQILFRQGTGDPNNPYAPFIVVNPGLPATDFALVQTPELPEIAALDSVAQQVFLYAWFSSAGKFIEIGSFATGSQPVRIASADLDGNGLGDIVVGNDLNNTLTIALQQSPGTFDTFTRSVGAGPSSITFANLNGDSLLDIVVSDKVSGDVSILFNDASHSFTTQERYRAGQGPFDVNNGPNGTTVLSQLQTVSVIAADFTGGGTDLVALNANTDSFSLLRAAGGGSLIDPQLADTYLVGPGAVQVLAGDFLDNGRQDVAALTTGADSSSAVWVYPNEGGGLFGAPIESFAGQGATGFTFLPGSGTTPDRFLVGNAYGDFLTLLGDGSGTFTIDRGNLDGKPLAVGQTRDGRQFVVVADQGQDQVQVYFRKPGTDQFAAPVLITSKIATLLAPGAVQLIDLSHDGIPDLVVASFLGNDILVYPGLADGKFGRPTSFPVGFEPVAFTAGDFNSDGVLDLAVANQGSNDVSILLGHINHTTHRWYATEGPRLQSGGVEPIAVQAGHFIHSDILDLRVTNRGGQIATLPGIGSGNRGTGFFRDINLPSPPTLPQPITKVVFNGGQEFLLGADGNLSVFNGISFQSVFSGPAISVFALAGADIVAAFANGEVSLLSPQADGEFQVSADVGIVDQPSGLATLGSGRALEVFITSMDSDIPVLLTVPEDITAAGAGTVPLLLTVNDFISVVNELPRAGPVAEATTLPNVEGILVATLLVGGLVEGPPSVNAESAPAGEVFLLFVPPFQPQGRNADNGNADNAAGEGQQEAVPVEVMNPVDPERPGWQAFQLGLEERWRQLQHRQQAADALRKLLDTLQGVLEQLQDLFRSPTTDPDEPGPQAVPPAEAPPEEGQDAVSAPAPEADVFACPDLLPPSAQPAVLPGRDESCLEPVPEPWPGDLGSGLEPEAEVLACPELLLWLPLPGWLPGGEESCPEPIL